MVDLLEKAASPCAGRGRKGGLMDLTPENKKHIDSLTYEALLGHWRFAAVGDPWFRGETGQYWSKRMKELRDGGAKHVEASKTLGWE